MPKALILLSALGPLREALYRAHAALDRGLDVVFVCFRPDVAEFLEPLRSSRVAIHLHSENLSFSLKTFPVELAAIRRFNHKLKQVYEKIGKAQVWAYASSISLTSILALHYFSSRYPVYYSGVYEGRAAADGIFYHHTTHLLRRFKAKLLSAVTGSDMNIVRDWSPVPVLSDLYMANNTKVAPKWNVATSRCELEKALLRPCNKNILLLFTNYSDYFGANQQDRVAFAAFCKQLGEMLGKVTAGQGVALKPHPTCSQIIEDWYWMEHLEPKFPLEFIDISAVRVVLGDASTSMISPLSLDQKPVISYAKLIKTAWAPRVCTYLDERVDRGRKVLRPDSWEELKAMIEREMPS